MACFDAKFDTGVFDNSYFDMTCPEYSQFKLRRFGLPIQTDWGIEGSLLIDK